MHLAQPSPIKHVFYIIKENRTYDQVFGDMPQGNGDPSLVHFGRDVTPNHHALAEQFVLLDNFYGPGDQSALGIAGAAGLCEQLGAQIRERPQQPEPDAARADRAIYDNAKARDDACAAYGERGANTITPSNATWTDIYNDWKNGTTNVHRRPSDHRRPARRLSPEVSRRRGPHPRSVPGGHLPEGIRGVRAERQSAQSDADAPVRRSHGRERARDSRPRARWWPTTTWRSDESWRRSRRAGSGRSRRSS